MGRKNRSIKKLTYNVYLPHDTTADVYPISVPNNANVKALSDRIRAEPNLEPHLKEKTLSLYQCGTVPKRPQEGRYDRALDWLRANSETQKLDSDVDLKEIPADKNSKMIDVVAAVDSFFDIHCVVYLPHNTTADVYLFSMKKDALVQDLEKSIRGNQNLQPHLEKESLYLFKCNDMPVDQDQKKRFLGACQWVQTHPDKQMVSTLPLSQYLPKGPACREQLKINVIAATESILTLDITLSNPTIPLKRKRSAEEVQVQNTQGPLTPRNHLLWRLWDEFWGVPISAECTGRPEKASQEHDSKTIPPTPIGVEQGDLLPGKPFLVKLLKDTFRLQYLVRAEYPRMYEYIEYVFAEAKKALITSNPNPDADTDAHGNKGEGDNRGDKEKNSRNDNENDKSHIRSMKPPLVVLTGQPGIGKTVWISYALRRRLGEKRPTILMLSGDYYLFTEYGVETVPDKSSIFTSNAYPEAPWCLIDSADADQRMPPKLSGNDQYGVNAVFVSSPSVDRWKKLNQSKAPTVLVMNPWTKEEIRTAALRLYGEKETKEALRRFEKYGPIARICLEFSQKEISEYESDCQRSIDDIKDMADALTVTIDRARSLTAKETMEDQNPQRAFVRLSHKIARIERDKVDVISRTHRVLPMSKEMEERCAARLAQLDDEMVLRVWKLFSKYEDARGMTGSVFESYVHHSFRQGIQIEGLEMFKYHVGNASKYHASFADYKTRPKLKEALKEGYGKLDQFTIDFHPLRHIVFTSDEDIKVKTDVYYQPESNTQVGIDSFFLHNGYLYLIQMTGGRKHDIKGSLAPFLVRLKDCPGYEKWRFVFLIPKTLKDFEFPGTPIDVGRVYTGKFSMNRD